MRICRDLRSFNRFSIPFCSRFQILHQDSRFQLGFQTICVGFQLVSGPSGFDDEPNKNLDVNHMTATVS